MLFKIPEETDPLATTRGASQPPRSAVARPDPRAPCPRLRRCRRPAASFLSAPARLLPTGPPGSCFKNTNQTSLPCLKFFSGHTVISSKLWFYTEILPKRHPSRLPASPLTRHLRTSGRSHHGRAPSATFLLLWQTLFHIPGPLMSTLKTCEFVRILQGPLLARMRPSCPPTPALLWHCACDRRGPVRPVRPGHPCPRLLSRHPDWLGVWPAFSVCLKKQSIIINRSVKIAETYLCPWKHITTLTLRFPLHPRHKSTLFPSRADGNDCHASIYFNPTCPSLGVPLET